MKKIGMRTFKTALAVFLCMILANIFKFDSPFYACIAAVICMHSSVSDSFTEGKNRLIGTFIGTVVGFFFTLISPGDILLSSIGIIAIIYICNMFKSTKSVSIACIVFLAIMINLQDKSPLSYSTSRLIETFVGIIISVLINYYIYPPKYLDNLQEIKENLIHNIFLILRNTICYNQSIELTVLNNEISDFEDMLKNYTSEITHGKDNQAEIEEFKRVLNFSKKAYSHLFMLKSLGTDYGFNDSIKVKIKTILEWDISNKEFQNTDMSIVYNYHVDKLIDILNSIKMKCHKD